MKFTQKKILKNQTDSLTYCDKMLSSPLCYMSLLLLQSALQPLWVMAAQLSLGILRRKVFTECRCQLHVKLPTWRTSDKNVPTPASRCPPRLKRRERTPAAEGGTMGEKFPRILPKVATFTSFLGSFTCRKFTTTCYYCTTKLRIL